MLIRGALPNGKEEETRAVVVAQLGKRSPLTSDISTVRMQSSVIFIHCHLLVL